MNHNQETILILGANGKTGGRIAQRLEAAGLPVRRGSRAAIPAFDWEDRSTWDAALDGVHAVYISYQPDLAVPGALETVQAFTDLAVRNGVRKLVLLSGRGEHEAEQAERVVQNSGVDWTILRASWFCQNFSEAHFLEPILQGELALPVGNIAEPFMYLFTTVLDGRNTAVSDGVQRALGRPARDFTDYVQRTAATAIWASGD